MKVEQISKILNDTFIPNSLDGANIRETLDNVVDIGRQITSSTEFEENFEHYVRTLIDKVGKVVCRERTYKLNAPDVIKGNYGGGTALQKIRYKTDVKFTDTEDYKIAGIYSPDIMSAKLPADFKSTLYNKRLTYSDKITITKKQVKEAFRSESEIVDFFNMIETAISNKMSMALELLIMRGIITLIGQKRIKKGGTAYTINLANGVPDTGYNAALSNPDFIKKATRTLVQTKYNLRTPSKDYGTENFINFTPDSNLKIVILSELASAIQAGEVNNTFDKEILDRENTTVIPYWQIKDAPSRIRAVETGSEVFPVPLVEDVVAVMFDEEALSVYNSDPTITSKYNPEGNFYNFWFKFDTSIFTDITENVVVFNLKPASVSNKNEVNV